MYGFASLNQVHADCVGPSHAIGLKITYFKYDIRDGIFDALASNE